MSNFNRDRFKDRQEAGQLLAEALTAYQDDPQTIVLGLPRGGVPVAFEIAKSLHVPLDVFIVRKLGVPGQPELAMGALATGGVQVFNEEIIQSMHISQEEIQGVIRREQAEISRREKAYRGTRPFPALTGKTIVLVDDGIATGATMRAAIKALRMHLPKQVFVAVPVAADEQCHVIAPLADAFFCLLRPFQFYAVGAWYDDFSQTEDEEVYALLKKAHDFCPVTP